MRDTLVGDDRGMSIAELMVAITLMLIVLAAAYAFSGVLQAGQKVSNREAALASSIAIPLARMQEIAIQNNAIDKNPAPTGYLLSLRTNQNPDVDDVLEQHTFAATSAGTITQVAYRLDAGGNRVGAPFVSATIGTDNMNVSSGTPLFRYFDANHAEITDMGLVPTNTKSIVIYIRATIDGRSIGDTSTVQFRNRD